MVSIMLGIIAGVVYGWGINPRENKNHTAENLRYDYKADYVLMVSEIYKAEGDIAGAADRLEMLGDEPVIRYVQQAILTAKELDYSNHDLILLGELAEALQSWIPDMLEEEHG